MELSGTRYHKARRELAAYPYALLKHPKPKNKLGRLVTKGKFKGYKVFSLTLEERATCPTSCERWADCYGNNMPFAHRLQHGRELEKRLAKEVPALCAKYPDGVLVRLHVLGDFYSPEYVKLWAGLLATNPNLAIWGYTHRNDSACAIHQEIRKTKMNFGAAFSVRWSDMPDAPDSASHESIATPDAITCPEQTGKTKSCATCGLCWGAAEKIKFLHH